MLRFEEFWLLPDWLTLVIHVQNVSLPGSGNTELFSEEEINFVVNTSEMNDKVGNSERFMETNRALKLVVSDQLHDVVLEVALGVMLVETFPAEEMVFHRAKVTDKIFRCW